MKTRVLFNIPAGTDAGEYIKRKLMEELLLDSEGKAKEGLQVRAFDSRMVQKMLSIGNDEGGWTIHTDDYSPENWEPSDDQDIAYAFYRTRDLASVNGNGSKRFRRTPIDTLEAVFKYE